ncbi:hypothetical protein [Glycomyces sp. NPDC021274]|uniref:hypothetical protein n=1 Tax=Glycomyces sp. NPDC021274 TaxID=3155120 RepID=UPI0033C27BF1
MRLQPGGIGEKTVFQTNPALAVQQLNGALRLWLAGDEVYGASGQLRDMVDLSVRLCERDANAIRQVWI